MKKKLSLLIAGLMGVFAYSQNVIFQQEPSYNPFDVVSTANTSPTGIFAADDFITPTMLKLGKVKFYGKQDIGFDNNLIDWNIVFFSETNGVPTGTPIAGNGGIDFLATVPKGDSRITVTNDPNDASIKVIEIDLTAKNFMIWANKKYWLVVYPRVTTQSNFFAQANWYWEPAQKKLNTSQFVDPHNLTSQGYTSWTNTNNVATGVSGLAFTIYEAEALATSEVFQKNNVVIFPNPATSQISIETKDQIKSSEIYSVDGKLLLESKAKTINISQLPKGNYFVKTTTENKAVTNKLIKK